MQEIAVRVRLQQQQRLGLTEYERIVGSVATVAALVAWLPTPDARLVLRGRTAEPVRVETASYGDTFEMLVVLDQRAASVERAAGAVASLVESAGHEDLADDVRGIAGELDRLDRAAPRGRSVVERTLRTFLEGARADVLARRTTTRVRAASALLRLAEDGAEITVERIADALVTDVDAQVVEAATVDEGTVVLSEPEPAPALVSEPKATAKAKAKATTADDAKKPVEKDKKKKSDKDKKKSDKDKKKSKKKK